MNDFSDHGGGHCRHRDKGRLNCYSPVKSGFKIKGSSPNPTEETLYKYMLLHRKRRSGSFGCDIVEVIH